MARVVLANWGNVPELIVIVAPYMDELLSLRKANEQLRHEKYVPNADLEQLLDGSPIRLRQLEDGKWSFSIDMGDLHTGGGGFDGGPEETFRRALEHIGYCWNQREQEHREAMGEEDD